MPYLDKHRTSHILFARSLFKSWKVIEMFIDPNNIRKGNQNQIIHSNGKTDLSLSPFPTSLYWYLSKPNLTKFKQEWFPYKSSIVHHSKFRHLEYCFKKKKELKGSSIIELRQIKLRQVPGVMFQDPIWIDHWDQRFSLLSFWMCAGDHPKGTTRMSALGYSRHHINAMHRIAQINVHSSIQISCSTSL